jgi:hypothetical protein
VESRALKGIDSLLSIVQMPGGIPVGTLAIGKAGATNAGLLAVAILSNTRPELRARLQAFREQQARKGARGHVGMIKPVLPGAVIGVLGSGQLGRMFAIAARRMGYRVHTYSPDSDTPMGQVSDVEWIGEYTTIWTVWRSSRGRSRWCRSNSRTSRRPRLRLRRKFTPVRPAGRVLHTTQNRIREKSFLADAGLPYTVSG